MSPFLTRQPFVSFEEQRRCFSSAEDKRPLRSRPPPTPLTSSISSSSRPSPFSSKAARSPLAWTEQLRSYRSHSPSPSSPPAPPPAHPQSLAGPPAATRTPPPPPPPSPQPSQSDWSVIRKLLVNIWPRSNNTIKIRVLAAVALLVGGKILNVQVPFWFKDIVDSLNMDVGEPGTVWMVVGWSVLGCEFCVPISLGSTSALAPTFNSLPCDPLRFQTVLPGSSQRSSRSCATRSLPRSPRRRFARLRARRLSTCSRWTSSSTCRDRREA